MMIRSQILAFNLKHLFLMAGIACGAALSVSSAKADEVLPTSSFSLWGQNGATPQFTASQGPSLLRPPASWAWNDAATPQLDLATGISHRFSSGLSLDAGLSLAHAYEQHTAIDYHDYFLGVSYGSLDGKVWYLQETALSDDPILYYEAGWQRAITDKLALSLRVGQSQSAAYGRGLYDTHDQPSLSLGASTDMGGYGLGLRLIDGGGMFGGEQDLRLMGSISRPLR